MSNYGAVIFCNIAMCLIVSILSALGSWAYTNNVFPKGGNESEARNPVSLIVVGLALVVMFAFIVSLLEIFVS